MFTGLVEEVDAHGESVPRRGATTTVAVRVPAAAGLKARL